MSSDRHLIRDANQYRLKSFYLKSVICYVYDVRETNDNHEVNDRNILYIYVFKTVVLVVLAVVPLKYEWQVSP